MAIIFFIVTLFYPVILKKVAMIFVKAAASIKIVHKEKVAVLNQKLFSEVDRFSKILWFYIVKKRIALFGASFWILAAFILDYFIALIIIQGFGFSYSIIKGIAIQSLLKPIIYFAPSPGGAGIWELFYLGFFSIYMPKYLLGIAVLLWRIFISYIPLIAGLYFFLKEFRNDSKISEINKKGCILQPQVI